MRGFVLGLDGVEPRLNMQRLDQRIRIEEQLQDGQQQAADEADDRTMRVEQRGRFE